MANICEIFAKMKISIILALSKTKRGCYYDRKFAAATIREILQK